MPKRYRQLRVKDLPKVHRVGFEPVTFQKQGTEPITEHHRYSLGTEYRCVTLLVVPSGDVIPLTANDVSVVVTSSMMTFSSLFISTKFYKHQQQSEHRERGDG